MLYIFARIWYNFRKNFLRGRTMAQKTVVVGMSGGVDSSVAALLLKRQGFQVIGLFMRNWEESDESGACTAEEDYADVERVCGTLGIPYYTVDFSRAYMERVFSHFLAEYRAGRTPNPDVLCNREIKFGPFKEYAKALGADYIATGHYCGISHEGDVHRLLKAKDANKDQTYFLNQVTQAQLADVLFPLGDLTKAEVRAIAAENGFATAKKKDSTGICFIGERNFRKFLRQYLPAQPGAIETLDGERVGEHIGLMYYTLGQRRGLDLGGRHGEEGRWFVVKKDLARNVLVVSHGDEAPLYTDGCTVEGMNDIPFPPAEREYSCRAKLRYRQAEQGVRVVRTGADSLTLFFDTPQRAVTEGQYAVLYDETQCLGGGVITSTFRLPRDAQ